jgi:hypothetical protein
MDFSLKWDPKPNSFQINYTDEVMLIGSCFTEHIGNYLIDNKFKVQQNPNGILFDTLSVCRVLNSYIDQKTITEENLFYYNELWQSWQYHSLYAGMKKNEVLQKMNHSLLKASESIKEANWLIITLGSSFAYKLKKEFAKEFAIDQFAANCHKAPSQWFEKYLIPIEEQIAHLDQTIYRLRKFNPQLKIIFTISPVRHIRDGIVENNRSKARLLETVHHLVQKFNDIFYFPAYEIVIDVLRDYRFYDIDLVHPNYSATTFVINQFTHSFLDQPTQEFLIKIKPLITAMKHKAFQPESIAHKKFMLANAELAHKLQAAYPTLNLEKEINYFSNVVI